MTQLLAKPKRMRWCRHCRKEVEIIKGPLGANGRYYRRCHQCGGPVGYAPRKRRPRRVRIGSDSFWTKAADKAVGSWARAKGRCENEYRIPGLPAAQASPAWTWCARKDPVLQWAHGFGRKAYPSVRWDKDNSFCLCRSCHARFSTKPLEWDEFMRWRLGPERYEALRWRALREQQPDPRVVVEAMRSA